MQVWEPCTIHRPAEHALGPLRPAIRGGAPLIALFAPLVVGSQIPRGHTRPSKGVSIMVAAGTSPSAPHAHAPPHAHAHAPITRTGPCCLFALASHLAACPHTCPLPHTDPHACTLWQVDSMSLVLQRDGCRWHPPFPQRRTHKRIRTHVGTTHVHAHITHARLDARAHTNTPHAHTHVGTLPHACARMRTQILRPPIHTSLTHPHSGICRSRCRATISAAVCIAVHCLWGCPALLPAPFPPFLDLSWRSDALLFSAGFN